MNVSPVPFGFVSITPNLIVAGADAAIEFYKRIFGAVVRLKIETPEGKIAHAELKIGDTFIMLVEEAPEMEVLGPLTLGATAVSLVYYVNDVDSVFFKAAAAGCEVIREVENQFIGDRSGTLRDPFGHIWTIATRIEEVPEEEVLRRAQAFFNQGSEF